MPNYPRFVTGDDDTALRVTLKDQNGAKIDPADGEARLYATGFDNNDQPGEVLTPDTRKCIIGDIGAEITDEEGDPCVEFKAIGSLCDIGADVRLEQLYPYRIQWVKDAKTWRSTKGPAFIVEAWV